ncbi:MAG TPA: PIG-L family deacetylase [Pirellulales bacterium]|jgi:LmbE family N-acetylglucosaminyl deacetylase|nr:PIG-L family deacetylase [Pirellulales bacterium]
MKRITRRFLLAQSGVAAASVLPIAASANENQPSRALRILVAGGHPGDPEAGCGGTIARYSDQGHEVTCLYLTRGEAGIPGKSAREAADIRTSEAESACKILKARPIFADQIDGATEVTPARYTDFTKLIAAANPDVVLTQWPVDGHRDHRACSLLTYEAWIHYGKKFALYYYEVDLGSDTQCFRPTHYVDVTSVERLKRQACMAHQSQNPTGFYLQDHVPMLRFRGMECGCKLAEAFIRHDQSPPSALPA